MICYEFHIQTFIYIYIHSYMQACAYTHTDLRLYVRMCVSIYTYIYILTYILSYTPTYIHMYIHTYRERERERPPSITQVTGNYEPLLVWDGENYQLNLRNIPEDQNLNYIMAEAWNLPQGKLVIYTAHLIPLQTPISNSDRWIWRFKAFNKVARYWTTSWMASFSSTFRFHEVFPSYLPIYNSFIGSESHPAFLHPVI